MTGTGRTRPNSVHKGRFVLIASIFIGTQIVVLGLSWIAVQAIDTTRAYATGESLYSKGQNAAVLSLSRYAYSGDEADLAAFRASIGITLGDRAAREALERPVPDLDAAFAGFRRAGNSVDDIPGAIRFFRWFQHWGPFEAAVRDWREGDKLIDRLVEVADELQRLGPVGPQPSPERLRAIDAIQTLSVELATAEARFSDHIGVAARSVTRMVIVVLGLSSLVLWSLGVGFARSAYRRGIEADLRLKESEERFKERLSQAQKMETLGTLTGGIAHDFNNLLGAVIGNLDLLRPFLGNNKEANELADEASDAALRGAELIRQLLAFARRQPLQPKRIDVGQLMTECAKLLRRALGENIEIGLDVENDVWSVVADPTQLEAAITNLATNARDAMPSGGRLTIAAQNCRLDEAFVAQHPESAPGDYVMISVTDTGSGIPASALDKIFDPFFTTKAEGAGTGLGLSMVFGFLKQSGGHVNVVSEEGVGTTFRLYLPRAQDAGADVAQPTRGRLERGRGETVLVVEDNPAMRRTVVRQLLDLGYTVREAESADAAVGLLETGTHIDLLFTDVMMPGQLNGHQLARIARERWPAMKVALTTGFDASSVASRREVADNVPVLRKPYSKEDLGRTLRETLDR